MYSITDQQINFIYADIAARGIQLKSLQHDLVDHICVIIEHNLEATGDFESFYRQTVHSFYQRELCEIEEETRYALSCRQHLVFSKNQFFVLLFLILIGPFIACDIAWLVAHRQTTGWSIPYEIWGPTLVYSLFPLLIFLVLLLTPERFDPLIPQKSKVLLGIKPFIKIVPCRKVTYKPSNISL